jgi:DNA ligase D-like protein (predicted ligase)
MVNKARFAGPAALTAESPIGTKRPSKAVVRTPATFVESMECLGVATLPEGPNWTYEIKLDGFRLEAIKTKDGTTLYSRRRNVLNRKFLYIADALADLPDDTIIDGELVALDGDNRSDFHLLQNFRSAEARIHYYTFDILMLKGRSVAERPLKERRDILEHVLPRNNHVSLSVFDSSLPDMLRFVREHRLEGVVAKDADSAYEPGQRSGRWSKHRINQGQEFVVGGYTPGTNGFDALIVGVYEGRDLLFAARVRAGFIPATRREVFAQIKHLKTDHCPFANLPDTSAGRWGQGLTAEKMRACVWLKPQTVVRLDFLEFTSTNRLRHPIYIAIRNDKDPRTVVKEVN